MENHTWCYGGQGRSRSTLSLKTSSRSDVLIPCSINKSQKTTCYFHTPHSRLCAFYCSVFLYIKPSWPPAGQHQTHASTPPSLSCCHFLFSQEIVSILKRYKNSHWFNRILNLCPIYTIYVCQTAKVCAPYMRQNSKILLIY